MKLNLQFNAVRQYFIVVLFFLVSICALSQNQEIYSLGLFEATEIVDFDYDFDDNELFLKPAMCRYNKGLLLASGILKGNKVRLKYFFNENKEISSHELKFPKSVEIHDKVLSLFIVDDLIGVHTYGAVSFFNADWDWVRSMKVPDDVDRIIANDYIVVGWSIRDGEGRKPDLTVHLFNTKLEKVTTFSKYLAHPGLSMYDMGELVVLCGNTVVFSDLHSPNIFLLNSQLQLVDSLQITFSDWKTPNDYPSVLPLDILTVKKYIEQMNGSQINGIGALNDSTFIISGRNGNENGLYWKVEINDNKLALKSTYEYSVNELWYMNPSTIDNKILKNEDISFMWQLRKGVMIDGKHYLVSDLKPGFIGLTWTQYVNSIQFPSNSSQMMSSLIISNFVE